MNRPPHQQRLIGESSAFLEVLEHSSMIAPLDKPVLIIGERGTGKELIAARIHYLSQRWDQTYLQTNCAALSEELIDSDLFGHEVGAFTGANKKHIGRFERAHQGTLFLDELATLSGRIQEKLLRVIEYNQFERLGSQQSVNTNVRVIGATNEDLPALAAQNKFRYDLLDRLSFDVITIPPLRSRREDIPLLANHFGLNMSLELDRETFSGFSNTAMEVMMNYNWPGNIRELKNTVERSVYRNKDPDNFIDEICFDPFNSPYRPKPQTQKQPSNTQQPAPIAPYTPIAPSILDEDIPQDLKQYILMKERHLVEAALKQHQYSQKETASALGLTYHQLRAYLKKFKLNNIAIEL